LEALAATVVSLVAPYFVKGAEEFAKSAGKDAFEKVKSLVVRLQKWWDDDPVAAAAGNNLSKDPLRYGKILSEALTSSLSKDEALANDLRKLVEAAGPSIDVVQKMEIARNVTGADIHHLLQGTVRVEQEIKDAQNVTGFKADIVGGGR
jgi:hypothetical protein